jgi:hypothetical protein
LATPLGEAVERAPDAAPTAAEHVRVDHRRPDVGVPEHLPHRANVVAGLEQVRGE